MALRILLSNPTLTSAVHRFNERMENGGSNWKFYASDQPSWLPPEPGASAWRENYLLVDEDSGCVRGGYVLKHETFLLDGEETIIAHQQGPVAESVIDPTLRGLGLKMVNDALAKRPLQTGWGATIRKGWESEERPALVYVVQKGRFLRGATALRRRRAIATVLDIFTAFGIGQLALSAAQAASAMAAGRFWPWMTKRSLAAAEEPEFGRWADEVWQASKQQYRLVAVRDSKALNRSMPRGAWPNATPLKVTEKGRVIGWAAIRDHSLAGDALFGNLRVGSIVDALALPGHEMDVVEAATKHLRKSGVSMVGAIFSHPDWISAFRRSGYIAVPKRRGVGFSPALVERSGPLRSLLRGAHLTLIDADGPRIF